MGINLNHFGNTDQFYTERYKVLIRSNLDFLVARATSVPLIDRVNVYAFRFDIYRLLRSLGVPHHLTWTNAFINGIINPNDDISHLKDLLIINDSVIAKLVSRNNTIKK